MKTMTMGMMALLTTALPSEAGSLGRLFFTPEERRVLESGAPPKGHTGTAATLRLDGWVDAGGGRRFWIDGRPLREGRPAFRPRLQRDAVVLEWRGRRLRLRPGQTAVLDENGMLSVEDFADE